MHPYIQETACLTMNTALHSNGSSFPLTRSHSIADLAGALLRNTDVPELS